MHPQARSYKYVFYFVSICFADNSKHKNGLILTTKGFMNANLAETMVVTKAPPVHKPFMTGYLPQVKGGSVQAEPSALQ